MGSFSRQHCKIVGNRFFSSLLLAVEEIVIYLAVTTQIEDESGIYKMQFEKEQICSGVITKERLG